MTAGSDESYSADPVARSACRRRSGRRVMLLALALHGAACATVTYPGPRRPSSEVAIVESRDVAIDEIDGQDVRGKRQTFEVLPGDHLVMVRLAMVRNYPVRMGQPGLNLTVVRINRSGLMPFCVSARPRHHYVVEPHDAGSFWQPVVFDGAPDVRVPPCGPVAVYHRDDFPCDQDPAEVTLAHGVHKLTGCGLENVYGYDRDAGQWKSVTERAMFDMNCPGQALTVHHLGGTAVSVVGCGMRADYVANTPCTDGQCSFTNWVPNVSPR